MHTPSFTIQLTAPLVFCLCFTAARAASPATTQATTQPVDDKNQMNDLWTDLGKAEPWSSRAILDFYDKPTQAVAFFKGHLKPLKIEQKDLDDTIAALGNDDEKIWKPAFEKLQYFDPRLNEDVETLLQNVTDPLSRTRLVAVLTNCQPDQWKGYEVSLQKNGNRSYLTMNKGGGRSMYSVQNKISEFGGSKTQWEQADRALVLLQHIGTPDAVAILKEMAAGNPAAQPTKIAKAALESLGQPVKW